MARMRWVALLTLAACDKTTPGVAPAGTPDPHVLILVVDGVRIDEFSSNFRSDLTGVTGEEYADETWEALQDDAMIVRGALNTCLPSTAPSHAMILTGRHEPVMTVALHVDDPGVYRPLTPTLFEEAREQLGWGEEEALLMANSVVMPNSTFSIAPGYGAGAAWEMVTPAGQSSPAEEDTAVIDRLKQIINDGPPHMLLANMHNADRVAHTGDEQGYLNKVRLQSKQIASFYRWLEQNHPDYLWQLQIVVTADHGRHRHELEGGWSQHGDSCDGCREVPLFVLGGGVDPGVITGGFALQDIAPTLAAHLGVDLPWAEGLPFGPEAGQTRRGDVQIAGAGSVLAVSRYRDDLERRSELVVDGEILSSPEATLTEAPVVSVAPDLQDGEIQGEDQIVCFRELIIDPEEDWWPFLPRCFHRNVPEGAAPGAWRDIGFPDDSVGPFWQPGLSMKDGLLYAAWIHTPLSRGVEGDVDEVRRATWSPADGWGEPAGNSVDFITTTTSVAQTARGAVTAIATNDGAPDNAYTRRIEVQSFGSADPGGIPIGAVRFTLSDFLTGDRRVEQPVLSTDGSADSSTVRIAMIGIDEEKRGLAFSRSDDDGVHWAETVWIEREGLFPHLPPAWDGDWLVWAEVQGGEAAICRVHSIDDAAPACLPVGSARVDSFVVQDGAVRASVDQGIADWGVVELAF